MTAIGITGHTNLTPFTRRAVAAELAGLLAGHEDLVGWSSLADGADQLFAWSVLAVGGELVFVQPCDDIETGFADDRVDRFRAARSVASRTVAMPYATGSQEAYLAAGLRIVDEVDEMVAVWDGLPAVGKGGTGDVAAYCARIGRRLTVIWPEGSARG